MRAIVRVTTPLAAIQSGAPDGGFDNMRRGIEFLQGQNVLNFDGLLKIALADAEARAGDVDRALAILDEALATAERAGYRSFEAELHRVRGEMLLKREPANPAAAEAALQTAIAVAKRQATRSFELRATLLLAKLYQSTGRPIEAHNVLAQALEGFSPTSEMPEIAEAQALLTALAKTDEVKAEAAQRQRRSQLHVSYGNALLHGRGMSSPETTAAFAKARALAEAGADPAERFSTYYGLWVGPFIRGDLASMREVAEMFLADVEQCPDSPHAGVAHRLMGTTCWYSGDYVGARPHLDRALAIYDHDRDLQLSASFGYDQGVAAKFYLGMSLWALGETDRGAGLVEDALSLALRGRHIPTMALTRHYMIVFATVRRQLNLATAHAQALFDLDLKHGLPNWRAYAKFQLAWVARDQARKPYLRCEPPWPSSARAISSWSCQSLELYSPKRRLRRANGRRLWRP
jgi:tetratricopeptide (TPR) repeat protein